MTSPIHADVIQTTFKPKKPITAYNLSDTGVHIYLEPFTCCFIAYFCNLNLICAAKTQLSITFYHIIHQTATVTLFSLNVLCFTPHRSKKHPRVSFPYGGAYRRQPGYCFWDLDPQQAVSQVLVEFHTWLTEFLAPTGLEQTLKPSSCGSVWCVGKILSSA